MNLRKLIFNDSEVHLVAWKGKPCFIVSELSAALDAARKDDIQNFLRGSENAIKGEDYNIIEGADAKAFRNELEACGIVKKFSKTTIIYFQGLNKYFDFRKTMQIKDFKGYLANNKIDIDNPLIFEQEISARADFKGEREAKLKTVEHIAAPAPELKVNKKTSDYSDLVKHIEFIEDFVQTFNRINIKPEQSMIFAKSMVKFLEDTGVKPEKLINEMKKWI